MTSTPDAPELWTAAQVAAHLGIAPSGVATALRRLGISPAEYTRLNGRGQPRAQYRAAVVRAAAARRPGQGARTDLS
ncbi:hypothetical protein [Kitasatospora sp. NPDC002965]|uniref:hypothetical protein n=1 Tax=Kitasatospora sp. NPDC002965 TaxID=3154775 RepID=UPI0033A89345